MSRLFPAFLALVAALLTAAHGHANLVLIGGDTRNGNFQSNFNNETLGNNWGVTGLRANGTTPIVPTVAATGRAFLPSSETNATISLDNWSGTRLSYVSGNNAWGLDGANGAFGSPNVYLFQNSGSSEYVADVIPGSFSSGDKFVLSLDLFTQGGGGNGQVTGKIDFGNGEVHTFAPAQNTSQQSLLEYESLEYTLLNDATQVTFSFVLDTVTAGSQTLVDNIQLSVIPEGSAFVLVGLPALGIVLNRRRRRA